MIDIASYAIMSNHYHIVLRVDVVAKLTERQIIKKWHAIFKHQSLTKKFLVNYKAMRPDELIKVQDIVSEWRKRLADISWFMRCMNENIARRANKSNNCTGRFWEGRFKSQALLDNKAVLACMAYVDLHPVRVGISNSAISSPQTAIKKEEA